ncbi:PREDICTED: jasmonate O-methyltransferase-like [Fragaria vesca subsp. vesca]
MEVGQVLHMNKGDGKISYARNSTVQRKTLSITAPIIEKAVLQLLGSNNIMGLESMGIADLGCSSGPNTLLLMSQIMDVIHAKRSKVTELRVSLNDLYSNDFNTIFMSLPSFYNKLKQDHNNGRETNQHVMNPFISAVPGSFYGPLFPRKSMHFIHSSFSLHWLSQVPHGLNNKRNIYISKSSPQCVLDSYSMQFQKDFYAFLSSRAQEIVDGGRMVLSFLGRPSSNPTADEGTFYLFELLAHALMAMVSEGLIEEEKVNSFNLPYYTSCEEELNLMFQKEGSFIKDQLEAFQIDWDTGCADDLDHNNMPNATFDDDRTITSSGQRVANNIRVVVESMLESHFGKEIMDVVFQKYAKLVSKYLSSSTTIPKSKYTVFVISLVKKN